MNMKFPALTAGLVPSPALLLRLLLLLVAAAAASGATLLPTCQSKCGAVDIPYPFGIGENCFMDGFNVTCNGTLKRPFLGNVEIVNISLPLGQIRLLNQISWQCYNVSNRSIDQSSWILNLQQTPFRFNDALNKFTVIGCHTLAYILGDQKRDSYQSGCVSVCADNQNLLNGTCSGSGCCQTSVPKDLEYYYVLFDPNFNNSGIWNFSRCSYAVMLEADRYEFRTSDISTNQIWGTDDDNSRMPVVVDWAIGNQTCEIAKGNLTSYACLSSNSVCVNSSNGPGYLCNCSTGYQGNPYLLNGCHDINECGEHPTPCSIDALCENLQGNYKCICPRGTHGEPYKGTCTPDIPKAVKVVIGVSSSLVFIIFCTMCIFMITERRKRANDKERYFKEHGGRLLLEEMKEKQGLAFMIFTKEELEKATNKFDQSQILGRGGHGTVYKGVLQNKRIVAVKKSKIIDEKQMKEFGKEMLILSQINHKNIVKLLGCCLEVEVPMLVYEFIPNGTLFHLIHDSNAASPISLATRLRIAYESADALAYLHSSASPPIIHGDVKTANILLDENYNAKISDFGASRLNPRDEDQLATLVQGTCGYLDPEYFQTCQLTDKSDVYSFGVVLLEVLTGRKAIYFEGSEQEGRSLTSHFFLALKDSRFSSILDNRINNEGDLEMIQELGELIKRCLDFRGDERPTMKEVAEELHRINKFQQHPWVPQNPEEITCLLGEPSNDCGAEANYHSMDTTTCYVAEKGYALNIESEGR